MALDWRIRNGLTAALMVMGVAGLSVGGFFLSKAYELRTVNAMRKGSTVDVCLNTVRSYGFKAERAQNMMVVKESGLDDPTLRLGRATVAVMACPGMALDYFCFGIECGVEGGGYTLRLRSRE
ncbi:MAG: hypothetical protein K2Q10_11870 [Rhodospirillales bacterium]|nr:hypothetical protein [Rhodospirillales bacterium]